MLIPQATMANVLGTMLESSTPQAMFQMNMVKGMVIPSLQNAADTAQDKYVTRAAQLKTLLDDGVITKEDYDDMLALAKSNAKVSSEILAKMA